MRDLERTFLDSWDSWLQNSIAESKAQLGDAWLDTYLTSPIWRFAIQPGVCGSTAWAGILMPSVDRVGRYFPLTIANDLATHVNPFQVAALAEDWFVAVEELALRTLDDDQFEATALQAALAAIAPLDIQAAELDLATASGTEWSLVQVGPAGAEIGAAYSHALTRQQAGTYSLWWTHGAEAVLPSALAVTNLPNPQCFGELLRGTWEAPLPAAADSHPPVAAVGDLLGHD